MGITSPTAQQQANFYQGNPAPLQQKVQQAGQKPNGIPNDLQGAIALEEVLKGLQAAQNTKALQGAGAKPTVVEQIRMALAQTLAPHAAPQTPTPTPQGVAPQGIAALTQQQPQAQAQPEGIDTLPSGIQGMAGGGIVAFNGEDDSHVKGDEDPYGYLPGEGILGRIKRRIVDPVLAWRDEQQAKAEANDPQYAAMMNAKLKALLDARDSAGMKPNTSAADPMSGPLPPATKPRLNQDGIASGPVAPATKPGRSFQVPGFVVEFAQDAAEGKNPQWTGNELPAEQLALIQSAAQNGHGPSQLFLSKYNAAMNPQGSQGIAGAAGATSNRYAGLPEGLKGLEQVTNDTLIKQMQTDPSAATEAGMKAFEAQLGQKEMLDARRARAKQLEALQGEAESRYNPVLNMMMGIANRDLRQTDPTAVFGAAGKGYFTGRDAYDKQRISNLDTVNKLYDAIDEAKSKGDVELIKARTQLLNDYMAQSRTAVQTAGQELTRREATAERAARAAEAAAARPDAAEEQRRKRVQAAEAAYAADEEAKAIQKKLGDIIYRKQYPELLQRLKAIRASHFRAQNAELPLEPEQQTAPTRLKFDAKGNPIN